MGDLSNDEPKPASYDEFWPVYLCAHRHPGTRAMHYAGTATGLGLLLAGILRRDWRLMVAAPVVGYGCAWTSHRLIEGNRPATFGHPVWSFYSDIRMLGLWATGNLEREFDRLSLSTEMHPED